MDAPQEPQSIGSGRGYIGKLLRLHRYVRKHRALGLRALVMLLFATLLQLPLPLVTKYVIDDVLTGRVALSMYSMGAILVALALAMAAVQYLSTVWAARFRERVLADIELALYEHTCGLPWQYIQTQRSGYLMARISGDVRSLQAFLTESVVGLLQNVCAITVGVVAMFALCPLLAVYSLAAVPLYVMMMRLYQARIRRSSATLQETIGRTMGLMQEGLNEIMTLKLMNAEEYFCQRVRHGIVERVSASIGFLETNAKFASGSMLLTGLVNAVVIGVGGHEVLAGQLSLGTLIAFAAYVGYVFNPIRSAIATVGSLQTSLVCLDRINELFDRESEGVAGGSRISCASRNCDVEFRNVSYRYPDGRGGIHNVSLVARGGQRIALVGRSGSGKTTLAMLITKLLQGYSGSILLGGRELRALEPGEVRRLVSVVPQQISLISGTIRENILCGSGEVDADLVADCCRRAHVKHLIDEWEDGWETEVGSIGSKLSGGERQRLALARALIRAPKVLILDEATSELDGASEQAIRDSLSREEMSCTVITIAHRMSSVVDADEIYVLEDGAVVARGTHADLMERCALYRHLYVNCDLI